ncbi:MAG: B12-binding domain-containing radical SAM protein, partial [Rudaea sp.]
LPFAARDTPPQQYLGIGLSPIVGSRGCYRDCTFCSIRAFYGSSHGKPQRYRRVSCLLDEMEMLYHEGNVRFFIFNDDEWFVPGRGREPRVAEMERGLARRSLNAIMSIKCRADDVEENLFRRLKEMGVVRAYVGVESGSDHSLATLNKKTTVAQNRNALEVLHRVGMLADFGLIFFDPDSTVEDIRANLAFFQDMAGEGQAPLSFGRMEVYAGTPILARLQKEGRLTGNYIAWNYQIPDPRVELLFRMMVAALRHRNYSNDGMCKQSSIAYYELTMYEFLRGRQASAGLREYLRDLVARVNNHSLAILREMLDYTLEEDIYNANGVNDQVARWATAVNLFDMQAREELSDWRTLLAAESALDGGTS